MGDDFLGKDIELIRYEHLKLSHPTSSRHMRKEEPNQTDFVLGNLCLRLNQLFNVCDMNNSRFYKYETHLLSLLANYLHNSFSNTVQYLAIDMLFPVLMLIKRQIIELSHPILDNIGINKQNLNSRRFGKKDKDKQDYSFKAVKL